jgi:hypothetical protein
MRWLQRFVFVREARQRTAQMCDVPLHTRRIEGIVTLVVSCFAIVTFSFCPGGIQALGNSVLPCVLLSALRAQAEVAQRLPREAAAVLIRPHDDQPLLIPDNKPVWLLRLLGCDLFRHFPPYCCPEVSFLSCRLLKGSACARRSAPEMALLDSLCYPLTMVRLRAPILSQVRVAPAAHVWRVREIHHSPAGRWVYRNNCQTTEWR